MKAGSRGMIGSWEHGELDQVLQFVVSLLSGPKQEAVNAPDASTDSEDSNTPRVTFLELQ